jgi:hypothetical protein
VLRKKDEAEAPHASQEATQARERERAAAKREEVAAKRALRRKQKREAQEHREEARHQQEEEARANQPQTVPDESDQRLDVAEEELEAHNWHFKVVGGGLFGVVVKSDWTVCETRPAAAASVPADTTIRLIIARACP